jgi:hypothetical protein
MSVLPVALKGANRPYEQYLSRIKFAPRSRGPKGDKLLARLRALAMGFPRRIYSRLDIAPAPLKR